MFKKWYRFFVILIIFILSGCGKNVVLNINPNNITNIVYDGVNIASSDFEGITNRINDKIFYDLENIDVNGKKLVITTSEYSYNLEVFENFIVYTVDNKRYYTKIDKIDEYFKDAIYKYEKEDFFKIDVITNYDVNNSDYLIKLDDSNQFIIINTLLNIYDFEINTNNYVFSTQNKINKIESNKIICIETNNLENINIHFKNPYNYEVSITYNGLFITSMKKANQ